MKIGFEREFFVKAANKYVLCPSVIPHDECGYLAESRGEPHEDATKAAFLLLAEEFKLKQQAKRNRVTLALIAGTTLELPLLREALRRHGKPLYPNERGNLYGLDYPVTDNNFCRAGLHVHFSNQYTFRVTGDDGKICPRTYNGFLDIPKLVKTLDVAFKQEIANAKRIPGFYELKVHGFEYRSLPSTVNPCRVAQVLQDIKIQDGP